MSSQPNPDTLTWLASRSAQRHRQLCQALRAPCLLACLALLCAGGVALAQSHAIEAGLTSWSPDSTLATEADPTPGNRAWMVIVLVVTGLQGIWLLLALLCWLRVSLAYRLPLVGRLLRHNATTTLCQTYGLLSQQGVDTAEALETTAQRLRWPALRRQLRRAIRKPGSTPTLEQALDGLSLLPAELRLTISCANERALVDLGRVSHQQSLTEAGRVGHTFQVALFVLFAISSGLLLLAGFRQMIPMLQFLDQLG